MLSFLMCGHIVWQKKWAVSKCVREVEYNNLCYQKLKKLPEDDSVEGILTFCFMDKCSTAVISQSF